MASLTAHLLRPDDHGRLAFHPECPLCRTERLAGTIAPEPVVGRRTQALVAAGVLSLSTTTPTAVLAAEPDHEQEGATAPEQVVANDPASAPGFDPGGESTDLPFDAAPVPEAKVAPQPAGEAVPVPQEPQAAPDPADDAPLEAEPVADEVAPTADPGDGTGTESVSQQAPPATVPPPAPPAQQPAATPAPPPSAPVPEPPAATPAEPEAGSTDSGHERKPETARKRHERKRTVTPSQTNQAAAAPQPEPVLVSGGTTAAATVQSAQPPASASAAVSHRGAAQRGDRFHVVQRGESLWSIARDVLGDSASTARIAREVNRLWELNSTRIGTGDRDLLLTGTRLAL